LTLDHPLLGKTGRTLLVMLAALAVPYASPRLRALRVVPAPWDPIAAAEDEGAAAPPAPVSPVAGEQALPASQNTPTVNNALPAEAVEATGSLPDIDPDLKATLRTVPIEDPTGHALDAFYARLRETDAHKPGAVTRILHYGDSTIASDYISGTARRRLQARFGDAGHGFILTATGRPASSRDPSRAMATTGSEASRSPATAVGPRCSVRPRAATSGGRSAASTSTIWSNQAEATWSST
jgi:hypothetical protein